MSLNIELQLQESLQSENVLDPMDAEQTWPTEEELKEAKDSQKDKSNKIVPKGTSAYQSAWIIDEIAGRCLFLYLLFLLKNLRHSHSISYKFYILENVDDLSDEEDEMSVEEEPESDNEHKSEDEEYESVTLDAPVNDQRYDEGIDLYEERKDFEKMKRKVNKFPSIVN